MPTNREMTDKEKVQTAYKDARYTDNLGVGVIVAEACVIGNSGRAYHVDGADEAAWTDAASKLPAVPPIAEPAKAETCSFFGKINGWCLECGYTHWITAPQPVIDDAPEIEVGQIVTGEQVLKIMIDGYLKQINDWQDSPDFCKHFGQCSARAAFTLDPSLREPEPTPTVIPDAKDEEETSLEVEARKYILPCVNECGESVEWSPVKKRWVHSVHGRYYCDMGAENYIEGAAPDLKQIPQESKPLPSEPQPTQQPFICRCGCLIFVRPNGTIVPHWNDPDIHGEQQKCQMNDRQWCDCHLHEKQVCDICQLAAKPSESAEGFDRWVKTRKRPGQFGYGISDLEAAWNAAKAEKVEESSITNDDFNAWNSTHPVHSAEARDVRLASFHRKLGWDAAIRAICELKKRSVGEPQ